MAERAAGLALKERLPRAWPAFFERHGNFTAAQLATIPVVLEGHNAIVCAPTASGKTEAALAPLIERYCRQDSPAPAILYLAPTRALVNDLAARLAAPLETLGLSLGLRTRDQSTVRAERPPAVLLTTPESVDALLATQARLFAAVRAVVIDELHLLDGTPRGDQLRVVLNRLRRVRAHACARGDAPDAGMQCVALSATLAHPEAVASRYFPDAEVIRVAGGRAVAAELVALSLDGADELIAYLEGFRARGWRKALVFCNSRAEVEAYATAVRGRSPFGGAVYVHYSNLEARRRREIERQFAAAEAAICFASTTLELGIDIGSIDMVVLVGPPGSPASFVQRLGRGNRRASTTHVACLYRTPLERLMFEALTVVGSRETGIGSGASSTPYANSLLPTPFQPAVAVQQVFSLIKQSPSGGVRLAELSELFAGMLPPADLHALLEHLWRVDYLAHGRPGEWRAGPRLADLLDRQGSPRCPVSIYSNIATEAQGTVDVRDRHTHETVARVDAQWFERPVLTLEGRPVTIEWADGEALWVAAYTGQDVARQLRYRSARQLLSYELARLLPEQLGLPGGTAPFIAAREPAGRAGGWWWFHWLGDLYGRALYDLLRYRIAVRETAQPGLCLFMPDEPRAAPAWTEEQVARYLADTYRELEPLLALGPFEHLLPLDLRRRAVSAVFDVPRFLDAVSALRPMRAPEALADDLAALLL